MELGDALSEQKKLDEALAAYSKAIEIDPQSTNAYFSLGRFFSEQKKPDKAIAAFQKIIEINPKSILGYVGLGVELATQKNTEKAVQYFRKAVEIEPKNAWTWIVLSYGLNLDLKYEEAEKASHQAIKLDPKLTDAYNSLGEVLVSQNKFKQAIVYYKKALEIDPLDSSPIANVGEALYYLGKLDESASSLRQSLKLDPSAFAYAMLGEVLRKQNKLDESIIAYREALKLPDVILTTREGSIKWVITNSHAIAHNGLGLALQEQGKLTKAISEFELAITFDADFTTAKNNLNEAKRLLEQQRDPKSPITDDRNHVPDEKDEPLVKILRSTAWIRTVLQDDNNFVGSGWVIKREGDTVWIVTNRHVLADRRSQELGKKIEVAFFSELPNSQRPRYQATIEQHNEEPDLAVLKVKGVPPDIQPLKFLTGRVKRSTNVTIIGHPITTNNPWNTADGKVMNYSRYESTIPLDANVAEGNSGGPVVDDQGQVIGMMVSIRSQEDVDTNRVEDLTGIQPATRGVGFAYRIDIIIEKLRSWGILNKS